MYSFWIAPSICTMYVPGKDLRDLQQPTIFFYTRRPLLSKGQKKSVLWHAICVCTHKVATWHELCHVVHRSSLILSAVFLLTSLHSAMSVALQPSVQHGLKHSTSNNLFLNWCCCLKLLWSADGRANAEWKSKKTFTCFAGIPRTDLDFAPQMPSR